MSKSKIGPNNPWVFGKGKPLTQNLDLNGIVISDNRPSYPSVIVQDSLGPKQMPTIPDSKDFVMVGGSDPNLPAVYDSKPSYPKNIVQDSLSDKKTRDFVFAGDEYLPQVVNQPSAEKIAQKSPWVTKVDDVMGKVMSSPITKGGLKILNSKPVRAVSKVLTNPWVEGAGMMLASPDVGASEAIDVKNMMWEKDPEAQAQAQELSSQLSEMMGIGIKPQIDQSRSVASIQPPQVVDQPQVESPQPSIIPSINSAKAQLDDQQLTGGNDKELSYQDIIKSQIDGLNNQMSNRSTLSYLDLSPLMQAVDNMTGSKMAQSYRGPKASADNDMAKVSGLAEKLADEAARKRQLDIQMQNALKNTADQKLQAAMQLAAFKDSLKGNGLSDKNLSDYRVNFLKDDRTKDIDALNDFNSELQDYLKEIQSVGNSWETLSSDKRAKIESAYNKLVTTVNRDYAKLGALAGADLDILKKIFPEMTGFGGALNRFKGANITNQITNIEDYQTKSKDRASKQFDKLTAAYPKEAIGEDLYNLYNNQLSNMKNPANTSSGRSPTTPVSNMTKSGTKTPTELEAEKILKEMGL
jgi:hypothetical protein